MPPAFIYIDGSAEMIKHTLAKLNEALFTEDKTKRKRAYIARSINPCDLKTFAADEPETADELLKRHGLEIHQINAEQREQSVNRILQNMQ